MNAYVTKLSWKGRRSRSSWVVTTKPMMKGRYLAEFTTKYQAENVAQQYRTGTRHPKEIVRRSGYERNNPAQFDSHSTVVANNKKYKVHVKSDKTSGQISYKQANPLSEGLILGLSILSAAAVAGVAYYATKPAAAATPPPVVPPAPVVPVVVTPVVTPVTPVVVQTPPTQNPAVQAFALTTGGTYGISVYSASDPTAAIASANFTINGNLTTLPSYSTYTGPGLYTGSVTYTGTDISPPNIPGVVWLQIWTISLPQVPAPTPPTTPSDVAAVPLTSGKNFGIIVYSPTDPTTALATAGFALSGSFTNPASFGSYTGPGLYQGTTTYTGNEISAPNIPGVTWLKIVPVA